MKEEEKGSSEYTINIIYLSPKKQRVDMGGFNYLFLIHNHVLCKFDPQQSIL